MPQKFDLGAERSFIGSWFLDDPGVCDALVDHCRAAPDRLPGVFVDIRGISVLAPEKKDSQEISLAPDAPVPAFQAYLASLQGCVSAYIEEFPYCNMSAPWTIVQKVNIQHYAPGGGYKTFHYERVSAQAPNCHRHLVFMTYLNDVTDAGGTEFLYQKTVVPARRGLTLIWPADWTHTHRGIASPTQEKFIITGWFNYV